MLVRLSALVLGQVPAGSNKGQTSAWEPAGCSMASAPVCSLGFASHSWKKQTSNCWRNPAEHSMAATSWVLRMGIQRDFICTGPSWLPGLFQGPRIRRWKLKAALIRVKWCYPSCVVRKLGSKKLIRSLSREKKQTVGIRCKFSAWKEFNSFIS